MTEGNSEIEGQTVKRVRPMTRAEMVNEGWEESGMVIVLNNGTLLYASRDDEGNGPGTIFGTRKDGGGFALVAR